jgi:large subunit ribosomal protein L25
METLSLKVALREAKGRKTNNLRAEGIVPGVVYGFEMEPTLVQMERGDLIRLYRQAGTSSVVKLDIAGKEVQVLIHEVQKDPLTDFLTHIDFLSINMKQTVDAEIEISLVGESPAVKAGGTLVHALDKVEVRALPNKLVKEIEVDVSKLVTFEDQLTVADIVAPEGVEITTALDEVIATVQAPRSEEEMAALDAPVNDIVAEQQAKIDAEKAKTDEAAKEEKAK